MHCFVDDKNSGREVYDEPILNGKACIMHLCLDVVEDGHKLIFCLVVNQHDVSIADDTGKCLTFLHIFVQYICDCLERLIAHIMTIGFVDVFEVLDVKVEHNIIGVRVVV